MTPKKAFNTLAAQIRQIVSVYDGAQSTITVLNDALAQKSAVIADLNAQLAAKSTEAIDIKTRLDAALVDLSNENNVDIGDIQLIAEQLGTVLAESTVLHTQTAEATAALAGTHDALTDAIPALAEAILANTPADATEAKVEAPASKAEALAGKAATEEEPAEPETAA
jgi:hypothetical protein